MSERSKVDEYLIQQIRDGSEQGWSQLVEKYHGRLLAFARSQLRDRSEADDIVQETFLSFLKGVDRFHTRASLETYLFTILRRRLVDSFRRRGKRAEINVCSLQDSRMGDSDHETERFQPESPVMSASRHVVLDEQRELLEEALWEALQQTVRKLQEEERFRDLQIVEMVFYAQLRNKEIGATLGMDEKQVALVKHRLIKKLSSALGQDHGAERDSTDESMLTRLWEQHRPSCPKRSTVGKWILGTLDQEWSDYVGFHIQTLGCRFCGANWEDLRPGSADLSPDVARQRIMQSSVGFFRSRG